MRRSVDQRALVVLAVDLDQVRGDARASVWALTLWSLTKARVRPSAICTRRRISSPSEGDVLRAPAHCAGWSGGRSNTAVTWPCAWPCAHQRAVAARAQRQRQRVEQDGFAGAGLAGQNRQPARKFEIQLIDQHDVADRRVGRA